MRPALCPAWAGGGIRPSPGGGRGPNGSCLLQNPRAGHLQHLQPRLQPRTVQPQRACSPLIRWSSSLARSKSAASSPFVASSLLGAEAASSSLSGHPATVCWPSPQRSMSPPQQLCLLLSRCGGSHGNLLGELVEEFDNHITKTVGFLLSLSVHTHTGEEKETTPVVAFLDQAHHQTQQRGGC